jgi:hypothetical protein
MKKNNVVFLCASLMFVLLLTNCDKQIGKVEKATTPKPGACDTITYTKHIQPILASSCGLSSSGCHGSVGAGGDLNNYAQVKAIGESGKIKNRVIDGVPSVMPLGGPKLPQTQLDLIQCWITNNYKQQ